MNFKLFTLATSLLLISWFTIPHSNDIENHEENFSKEFYVSTDIEVPELVKDVINSQTFKELYKYNLDIFLWRLNLISESNYDSSENLLKNFKSSDVKASFGFKNSLDFQRYLDLTKSIKEDYKLNEMDEASRNEFLGTIRMIQLESILNNIHVKKLIKSNKKLSEFVENMMVEKKVNNKTLFTFSCYKCVYDYMACLAPVQTNFTTGYIGQWWVTIGGLSYTMVDFQTRPPSVTSNYSETQCRQFYTNCLSECDPNW